MDSISISKIKSFWGKSNLTKGDTPHTGEEPVIISSDNYVVNGHKRIRHAIALGKTKIKCIRLDSKFEDTKPMRLLDNEIKALERWDMLELYRKALVIR